ncbi:hypothetical protein [Bradyrhizobium sp. SZCCHNRI3052]|uniref:hypothetical protein n=1 Tax=Bradyrhizobium sp. SZCCHNRI3052 TaxID=3057295 RepID=UPI0029160940|nr:hypothetical protein [Bradyrhizobium sp. SZCCHNRI3052]
MTDPQSTAAPGYVVKVYDHAKDDLARYFVAAGVADGEEAIVTVLKDVPEKIGDCIRNATAAEVQGMAPGGIRSISAAEVGSSRGGLLYR